MFDLAKNLARDQYGAFLQQLPPDWRQKPLNQVGQIVSGGTPSREVPSFWRGAIPWVTPSEVSGEATKLLHDTCEHISQAGLNGSGATLLPAGSLMVTTRATLGARTVNAVPMTTNQGFKSIVFKDSSDVDYYFHLFEKIRPELVRRASGTTFLEISGAEFGAILVPNPPNPEKVGIAQVLNITDIAIHQTEAIIEKLKQVKQGLLHDLLTRGVDANGELRPSYEQAPGHYKKSQIGHIPHKWNVLGLADLAPPGRSVIRTGPFGSSLKGEHWRPTGRAVVTIGSLGIGTFIEEELLFIDESTARQLVEYELIPGDIVFSRVADVGRSVVVSEAQNGWIMSSNFMRISTNSACANPHFLQLLLAHSHATRQQMRATINSGGRDVANSAILMGLRFPIPNSAEQSEIVSRVTVINDKITAEVTHLMKVKATKVALMDDLLTGRVRVTPLLAGASA
jgi:type I restriction enzyme S subunit